MAETWDTLAPLPARPIALAACLQVDAVCQHFIPEQSQGIHYNQANDLTHYLDNPEVFAFQDGFVGIPQGPGLGIEINEEAVERKPRRVTGGRFGKTCRGSIASGKT